MFVLITGSLWRDPTARQSKAGKRYVTTLVKAGTPQEALWANVIAFDTAAQSELLRLQAGDAVAVQARPSSAFLRKTANTAPVSSCCFVDFSLAPAEAGESFRAEPKGR